MFDVVSLYIVPVTDGQRVRTLTIHRNELRCVARENKRSKITKPIRNKKKYLATVTDEPTNLMKSGGEQRHTDRSMVLFYSKLHSKAIMVGQVTKHYSHWYSYAASVSS